MKGLRESRAGAGGVWAGPSLSAARPLRLNPEVALGWAEEPFAVGLQEAYQGLKFLSSSLHLVSSPFSPHGPPGGWEVGEAQEGQKEGRWTRAGPGPSAEARAAGPAPASHIWAEALAHPAAAAAARPSGLGEGEGRRGAGAVRGGEPGWGWAHVEGFGRRGRAQPPHRLWARDLGVWTQVELSAGQR